jgi:hypothetical protein
MIGSIPFSDSESKAGSAFSRLAQMCKWPASPFGESRPFVLKLGINGAISMLAP